MEIRPIQRNGFCRCCDRRVEKGEEIFYTYSHRNRGMSVVICTECLHKIAEMLAP